MPEPRRLGIVVEIAGGDHRQPRRNGRDRDRQGAARVGVAQPIGVAIVGDDQIEGAVGGAQDDAPGDDA